jgi:hypothetical protein
VAGQRRYDKCVEMAKTALPREAGHAGGDSSIFTLYMATDGQHFSQRFTSTAQEGAQCPNCFTLNLLQHLPENRKRERLSGIEVTCALCGTEYLAERSEPDAKSGSPIQEKGAA